MFCLDSNDLGLGYAGVNIVSGYIREMWPDLICFGTNVLPFKHQRETVTEFSETYGVIYGTG